MSKKIIRYRYAVLLLWASLILASNPVWYAVSHTHSDHAAEVVLGVEWSEEDLCPYCDAVSQFVNTSTSSASESQWIRVGTISPDVHHYTHYGQLWPNRLRAPPVQAYYSHVLFDAIIHEIVG